MAEPVMNIDIEVNDTCDGLLFTDETTYSAGTILSSTVTSVILRLDYSTLGTFLYYTFTISNNVITAARLRVASTGSDGAAGTDILAELASTVFPLVDFDLSADYGVTIPDVEDGIYYTTYTIAGNSGGAYSYNTTEQDIIACSACCCISKMFQEIDPNACCDDKKWMTAMRAASYLSAARYATQGGFVDNAVTALNKAQEVCDDGCGCN